MVRGEAEIVMWHLSLKEGDHIPTDSTRRGENCEMMLVLNHCYHVHPDGKKEVKW